MSIRGIILTALWVITLALPASAQGLSNLRQKKIPVLPGPYVVDSFSIVPGTFGVQNIAPGAWQLDPLTATLVWAAPPSTDSVWVIYRVFPYKFNQSYYRYRYDSIANFFKAMPGGMAGASRTTEAPKFMDFGNLTYTGSFGRSLSFGNSQDAVVNSLFNLQINGMLGDSIELAAAISDNNIPIQPDGTTQQLNEFDRIWLQFKKRPWEVNLGDIDVRQQPTYFLGFYKRQQGIAFQTQEKMGRRTTGKTFASAAIAKGKFTRNIFPGLEGNQGPYRLQGANGELYFVVLAGTERVFVDGVQLQRGEDQDYIINYNSAVITFTPRQLINKDKRIQVEFEYADRNYLNSLIYLGQSFNMHDKFEINVGWYSNVDAKNSSINQTLDNQQRQFLSEIGDSIQNAYYPVATPDSFAAGKILYLLVDTTVNGNTYQVYRYSSVPGGTLYNLSFSDLGQGKGNYIPSYNAANGKVFEWVAPLNNVPQGSYEPVALLVTPKQQQLFTASVLYRMNESTTAQVEAGYSIYDVNTFSSKDKGNDGGLGLKFSLNNKQSFNSGRRKLQLESTGRYEWVAASFKPLERLRTIEFLRDWGLPFNAPAATERLPGLSVALTNDQQHSIRYEYLGYQRDDLYQGHRHAINHAAQWKGWMLTDVFKMTKFDGSDQQGYFLRPQVDLTKTLEKWRRYQFGVSYALEHNEVNDARADSFLLSSFSFRDWKAFIKSDPAKQNRWSFQWMQRKNQYPVKAAFVPLDVNDNFNFLLELYKNPKHQFRLNTSYRMLQVQIKGITSQQSENTLLGRAEYLMRIWKGGLTGSLLYEAGAGQEQQRDYSYVEVPAGRGEFTWIDYDNDGVPQLNEFEQAQFQDQAKYIRIFTPTNQFVKANYHTLNYSLVLSPKVVWARSVKPIEKFLSRFNAQSSLQTSNKRVDDGRFTFDPFEGNANDSGLISLNTSFANTISFNRFSTKWGLDITRVTNTNKAILTYGFETRQVSDFNIRARKNFGRQWVTEMLLRSGTNKLITPNPKFDNRNYSVDYIGLAPSVTFMKGSVFRTQVQYRYDKKEGLSGGVDELSTKHSGIAEVRYNVMQSGVINGKFTYSGIEYNGATNTTVSYIMLEGLQPGKNILWTLDFTKRLANSLELSFQYEGRKAGDTRTVHIGRAALRAIL